MKRLSLDLVALGAIAMVAADAKVADAAHGSYGVRNYGFHIGGRNFHFDIGRPHRYAAAPSYRSHAFNGTSHLRWHDTTHLDWHSGGYVPHGNHVDYRPGHYDVHREGHFDRHGGHRGGFRRW